MYAGSATFIATDCCRLYHANTLWWSRYRVLAVDHDLLSFQDVHLNDQPIIVITNPKHHQFLSPSHEPVSRISHSTHIRYASI